MYLELTLNKANGRYVKELDDLSRVLCDYFWDNAIDAGSVYRLDLNENDELYINNVKIILITLIHYIKKGLLKSPFIFYLYFKVLIIWYEYTII